ncbi:GNAT family N-acetyltransferase [Paenibacillus sp. N3.4]|uniref:GNAT family N-acetyltransferase n=1 Tax=Paenibacillus sp. N3.4 TaxID=2603222 RepID=UPI0011C92191|nr:GNAT family N-acetyltransferase [Paenibacillus sp. N3.4]TXK86046.1 GNAT family N-acetyltransferase [Paenibacillus sp. N3.4]
MLIRSAITEKDLIASYEIEKNVYIPEAAASFEAFQMRMQIFGTFFLVAEMPVTTIETNATIIGVTNGVRLNHFQLADDSIKQATEPAVDGSYYCILTIAVHPDYQRQGVASQLLDQVIQRVKTAGLKGIVLMCEEHLIPFYKNKGFAYLSPSSSMHGGIQWHEMSLIWQY